MIAELPPPLAALCRATPGFFPENELHALVTMATKTVARRPGPLLEIGSYCGKSTIALGWVAKQAGTLCVTVDHHRGSIEMQPPFPYWDPTLYDPLLGRSDSLSTLVDTMELAELTESVAIFVGNSRTADIALTGQFSLVFIDGGHDPVSEWLDFEYFAKRVAPGGLLAIHDVFEHEQDGGRPPYEIMVAALHSGKFRLAWREGSLVGLTRTRQVLPRQSLENESET